MPEKRIDWKNDVVPKVKERLQERINRGVPKASLRGIFYALVSLEVIPNTQNAYKLLSRALVKAREDVIIPDEWIVDETRTIVDIDDIYAPPEDLIDDLLSDLTEDFPQRYKDEIPRWYKQPKYVEIWVEKKAMRGVFAAIINAGGRQVRIAPNGGWSSRSFSEENHKRLLKKRRREGKDVYVLYYGDYDPSGLRMVQKLKEELTGIGVHFEHVAITKEQIRQFHLEHLKNLDPAVRAKLGRDSNANYFRSINNGELFQIEVDALDALGPDDLKRLLLDNINEYFDEEIRELVLSDPKHQSKNIRRLVHKRLAEAKVKG
jgi:hypothetical protein